MLEYDDFIDPDFYCERCEEKEKALETCRDWIEALGEEMIKSEPNKALIFDALEEMYDALGLNFKHIAKQFPVFATQG